MEQQVKNTKVADRRVFTRYPVHYLADVFLGDEILFATVVDICEDGMGIVLPKKFYLHEILNIRINCSLINQEKGVFEKVNIYLRARVVWIEEKEGLFRAGLKLADISYDDLVKLRDHIKYLKEKAHIV
jgi:hypothetical protein